MNSPVMMSLLSKCSRPPRGAVSSCLPPAECIGDAKLWTSAESNDFLRMRRGPIGAHTCRFGIPVWYRCAAAVRSDGLVTEYVLRQRRQHSELQIETQSSSCILVQPIASWLVSGYHHGVHELPVTKSILRIVLKHASRANVRRVVSVTCETPRAPLAGIRNGLRIVAADQG